MPRGRMKGGLRQNLDKESSRWETREKKQKTKKKNKTNSAATKTRENLGRQQQAITKKGGIQHEPE